jgi:hypothetical protein
MMNMMMFNDRHYIQQEHHLMMADGRPSQKSVLNSTLVCVVLISAKGHFENGVKCEQL